MYKGAFGADTCTRVDLELRDSGLITGTTMLWQLGQVHFVGSLCFPETLSSLLHSGLLGSPSEQTTHINALALVSFYMAETATD